MDEGQQMNNVTQKERRDLAAQILTGLISNPNYGYVGEYSSIDNNAIKIAVGLADKLIAACENGDTQND